MSLSHLFIPVGDALVDREYKKQRVEDDTYLSQPFFCSDHALFRGSVLGVFMRGIGLCSPCLEEAIVYALIQRLEAGGLFSTLKSRYERLEVGELVGSSP